MSGQQATTLGGQIIGGAIGGGVGAAVGGLVGAVIGGALFNEDAPPGESKPTLADNKVQTSSFGGAVPLLFGSFRFAGNVIWCSDIRTVVKTTELDAPGLSGKGGGGQTVEEVEYFMDAAIAICEGEISKLERLFANGVLIYDASTATAMPAGVFLRDSWIDSLVEYPGSETQLPDPTIEAAVGVGNASAFRGTAYVVMTNLNLTALRLTSLPNFEVIATRGGVLERFHSKVLGTPTYYHYAHDGTIEFPFTAGYPVVRLKDGVARISSLSDGTIAAHDGVELWSLSGEFIGLDVRDEFEVALPLATGNLGSYGRWSMNDGTQVFSDSAQFDPWDIEWWFGGDGTGHLLNAALPLMAGSPKPYLAVTFCADGVHVLATIYGSPYFGPSQTATYWYLVEWAGMSLGFNIVDEGFCEPGVNGFLLVGGPHDSASQMSISMMESNLRYVWLCLSGSGVGQMWIYWINDAHKLEFLVNFRNDVGDGALLDATDTVQSQGDKAAIYADHGVCCWVRDLSIRFFQRDTQVAAGRMPLSQVIEEICVRSGIPSSDVDVTGLDAGESPAPESTTVKGFLIAKTMTAKAAIEVLRPGYFFDAVDGDKLKFILRGAAATDTFDSYYLGAAQDDAGSSELETHFDQPTELPARMNIRYISRDANYQWAAQSAQRETVPSVEVFDGEVPCVFEDWEAAVIAENNLRDIWASSGKRSFSSGLIYSKYEPTDVVFVDDGREIRQVRITRREDRGGLILWEAEDIDALMYVSRLNQIRFGLGVPSQIISPAIPSNVEVLDLPPLTETAYGNEVANYIAAGPYSNSHPWAGVNVQISRDDGVRFIPSTHVPVASVIGITLTGLRAWTGGNMFDTASRVRVFVNSGTLSSATHDQVLSGANAAAIGNEVVQFVNATPIDANTYELTQFLRGRKGTEVEIGSHSASERFVLLTTKLRDMALDIGDRNSAIMWVRAAGTGSASRFSTTEPFETQIARVMPYSPVHLTAVRLQTAEWRLRWNRRDRYLNDWNSGIDVPMSEADELYDVEVYSGSTLLATYPRVPTQEVIVPAGVLGASPLPTQVTFKVWQLSDLVGRGFVAQATVNQT